MKNSIKAKVNDLYRVIQVKKNPHLRTPINSDFSIISSNCNGAVLLHDLKLPFNSPFVNLWIKPKDFIRLLENFPHYMNSELRFIYTNEYNYPVGAIDDVVLYFQHYASEEEAKQKWNERKKRIRYENLFVMFTDRDGCTYEDLVRFDSLPYKKVVFTHKLYPELSSSFYIPGFETDEQVGELSAFVKNKIGVRYFDSFDFSNWLNNQ